MRIEVRTIFELKESFWNLFKHFQADDRMRMEKAEYELQLETTRIEMQRTIDDLHRELESLRYAQEEAASKMVRKKSNF